MSPFSKLLNGTYNIYNLHFKVYQATGYWKIVSKSKWKQLICNLYCYFVHCAFNFLTLTLLIDAYFVRKDLEKISTNLCSTITCVGTFIKAWVFIFNRKKINKICDSLENNLYMTNVGKSEADLKILKKYEKLITKVSKILWGMDILLVIFWSTFPIFDDGSRSRFPFPFPINHVTSPFYEMIYAYHVFVLITIAFEVLTYDMIFYGFVARICAQYDIMAKNISKINDLYSKAKICSALFAKEEMIDMMETQRDRKTANIIKESVIYHKAILKQIKEVEELFSIPILVQLLCGASLIGIVAYGIVTNSQGFRLEQLQRLFYVGCASFDIMVYCYFGTQLENHSNRVNLALYDNPWYEMKIEIRKLYLIIFAKLQNKVRIRGGGIVPIDLKKYLELLKISYEITAVFRQTRSRNNVRTL